MSAHPEAESFGFRTGVLLIALGLVSIGLGRAFGLPSDVCAVAMVATSCAAAAFAAWEGGLLTSILVLSLAGIVQGAAATIAPNALMLYIDDAPLGIIALWALSRAYRFQRPQILATVATCGLFVIVAILRANSRSVGVIQARQLFVALLIAVAGYVAVCAAPRIGAALRHFERAATSIAATVGLYFLAESIEGPPINPLPSLRLGTTSALVTTNGIPNNYYFYVNKGNDFILRLGGPFMNPPVAGLFMGTAAVIAFWNGWHRRSVTYGVAFVVFALATVGTLSRGGMLIVAAGIALPLGVRYFGRAATLATLLVAALFVAGIAASQGQSQLHSAGLLAGIVRAIHTPWGAGFGTLGNAARAADSGITEGESLAAIGFAAVGLPALIAYAGLLGLFLRTVTLERWRSGLGAAALLCALFTESASSVAGTAILWVYCGFAFAEWQHTRATEQSPREWARRLVGRREFASAR